MDCGLSYTKISLHQSLPLTVKTLLSSSTCFAFNNSFFGSSSVSCRRSLFVVASGSSSSSKCEFGGLNAPLEPTTPAGRLLSTVLLNDRKYFHVAVQKQLEQLAYQRDEAVARMNLSLGSDEAFLHRFVLSFCPFTSPPFTVILPFSVLISTCFYPLSKIWLYCL